VQLLRLGVCAFLSLAIARGWESPSAATLASAATNLSLDPQETYRVRDLNFARGDIKFYLSEGVLSFATQVGGKVVAAVFSTDEAEAGDAEVLVLPPQRSERSSLAAFTRSPNLDEHFGLAVFLFSDNTREEFLAGKFGGSFQRLPEWQAKHHDVIDPVLRRATANIELDLVQSLLDNHQPEKGFFFASIAGRELGPFNVLYQPKNSEPVSVGRYSTQPGDKAPFELWTAFRPGHAPPFQAAPSLLRDYSIDTTIHPDLSLSAKASFVYRPAESDGRAMRFEIAEQLHVTSAQLDEQLVEVFERRSNRSLDDDTGIGTFLLIPAQPLKSGEQHRVTINYSGSVIHQNPQKAYVVETPNAWYPRAGNLLATFDLTFHCPADLHLAATGDLLEEKVADGLRVVHRRTPVGVALAGFNVGDYGPAATNHGRYTVEAYANVSQVSGAPEIAAEASKALDYYTDLWNPLPISGITLSPVPGYFGQGFPGLIYLSDVTYTPLQDRPRVLRSQRLDAFFSSMLLPHEVAHQWWGNLVAAADYRSNWLIEAMANESALQYLARTEGENAADAVLDQYREDLVQLHSGKPLEAFGPVDFGTRLVDIAGRPAWHIITYEKGTWILHMLRQRLGDDNFRKMQVQMLRQFRDTPITNEDFRALAALFVPSGQPDRDLRRFFDTWVYSTGIPKITLLPSEKDLEFKISGVGDDFTADVPISCRAAGQRTETQWVTAVAGENVFRARARTNCVLPTPTRFLYVQ
jgi:hypothetical protein